MKKAMSLSTMAAALLAMPVLAGCAPRPAAAGGSAAAPAVESVSLVVRQRDALNNGLQFELKPSGPAAVWRLPEMRRAEMEVSEPLRARIMELAARTFALKDGDYAQTADQNMIGIAVKFAGGPQPRKFQLLYGRSSPVAAACPKDLLQLLGCFKEIRGW